MPDLTEKLNKIWDVRVRFGISRARVYKTLNADPGKYGAYIRRIDGGMKGHSEWIIPESGMEQLGKDLGGEK